MNKYKNIPLAERPKLYDQMMAKPYELNELDPKELFVYLQGVKKPGKFTFKYYSEFLNILNSLVFFYLICHYNCENTQINIFIFLTVDSVGLIFTFLNYFLIRNKETKHSKMTLLFLFLFGFAFTKLLSTFSERSEKNYFLIHKYYKLNFIICSFAFLFAYNYSSLITRILIILLAVILSTQTQSIEQITRIFLYSFEFFEFIPQLRKFLSSYSSKHNIACYIITLVWYISLLLCLSRITYAIRLITWNVLIIHFYPQIFEYYYDNYEILIRGLWDLPNVTSYT